LVASSVQFDAIGLIGRSAGRWTLVTGGTDPASPKSDTAHYNAR
jgi:hypothetical protein